MHRKVKYSFNIRRNITLIRGDSASGKTTLINMIDAFYNEGKSSGVNVVCEKECVVLKGKNWERDVKDIRNSIVFIDEGSRFTASHDFARVIKNTDNYYVIITRRDLDSLPYSVNEIYGIRTNGKRIDGTQIYNEMYMLK